MLDFGHSYKQEEAREEQARDVFITFFTTTSNLLPFRARIFISHFCTLLGLGSASAPAADISGGDPHVSNVHTYKKEQLG